MDRICKAKVIVVQCTELRCLHKRKRLTQTIYGVPLHLLAYSINSCIRTVCQFTLL